MKSKLFITSALLLISSMGYADITVNLPQDCDLTTLDYYYAPIQQYAEAKTRSERGVVSESVKVSDHRAKIEIPSEKGNLLYVLNIDNNNIDFYVAPDENINVEVSSCSPFVYSLSGTDIVEGISKLNASVTPLLIKADELNESGKGGSEEMEDLARQYVEIHKKFISENRGNPTAPIALLNLEGEDFINTYNSLQSELQSSIVAPLANAQYEREKKGIDMENKQKTMQSGTVEAPGFTLKNLDGKDVSLSEFRGKWVILDFWGSWCPWCIKGFPELKDIYKEYSDNLTIIGIDCNESEADWRTGVEKYSLPWVNVYNPAGTTLLSDYGVQGFPTKVIISPDGVIKNITVGHNPEFSKTLASLINQ